MNNLERIKNMSTKELAKVLNGSQCNCCAYKNTLMSIKKNVCEQSNCEEGVKLWLEQDAEFTITEVREEKKKAHKGEISRKNGGLIYGHND